MPTYGDGPLSRWCKKALYEPRDEVFVRLGLRSIAIQLAGMIALFVVLRFTHVPAVIPVLAYFALWGWQTPPIILLLHCTMHRKFIQNPKWLEKIHPFVMSFFFGMPTGYREHHIGMHHVEDNMQRRFVVDAALPPRQLPEFSRLLFAILFSHRRRAPALSLAEEKAA